MEAVMRRTQAVRDRLKHDQAEKYDGGCDGACRVLRVVIALVCFQETG